MNLSRRAFLSSAVAATTAGCVDLGATESRPGRITVGEQTQKPATDGSLSGVTGAWPTAQFDARNVGFDPGLSTNPAGSPQVKWRSRVAEGEDALSGSPSLRDGLVFVTTDEELVVLNATTGASEWSSPLPSEGVTTPTVTERRVFLGTENGVVAVDRDSRTSTWTVESNVSELAYENPEVNGAPTVREGIVFAGTYDGALYALDASTGERRWATAVTMLPDETEAPSAGNTPFFQGPPAVAHGAVFASNANGYLYAFDVTTGEERWRVEASEGGFGPGPTVIEDTVYAVSQVELVAVAADGTVRWRFREDPGSMKDSAVVLDDAIYVASGESYGELAVTALDRRDRSVQWRVDGRPQTSFSAGPEHLYVPLNGNLVAIDRNTGEIAWEMETASAVGGPPVVTGGGVITADEQGTVYGIGSVE